MYKNNKIKLHRISATFLTLALVALAFFVLAPSVSSAQTAVLGHHWIGFNGNSTIYMSTGVSGFDKANSGPT